MYSPILCSKCQLDHLVTDPESGEIICSICGLVVQENMEDTKLQYYEKGIDTRGKEPSSFTHYDMGLSTIIGKTDIDAKGQRIQPSGHSAIQNLRNWDHRIQLHNSRDMNMKRAFNTLNRLKDKLRLSDVTIEKVAYIYRKALLNQLIRGRSIDSIVVAAAYIGMGEALSLTSLKEISEISNIHQKTIGRMVRLITSELGILIPVSDPIRCVTKVGNILGLSEKTKREAFDLMSHIKDSEYSAGKKPMGLAATILYIACNKTGENMTQKEIAKAAGVTEVTMRNRLSDLKAKNLVQ